MKLLIFVIICKLSLADNSCVLPVFDGPPSWDTSDICNSDDFSELPVPQIRNLSLNGKPKHDCGILFLFDLDNFFLSRGDFEILKVFLKGVTETCQERGIGANVVFKNMFSNSNVSSAQCCDGVPCDSVVDKLAYDNFVGTYDSIKVVQKPTNNTDFFQTLLENMKTFSTPGRRCLYNTVIMITSRIFDSGTEPDDIADVLNYACETFTIVAVNNPVINTDLLFKYYSDFTLHQYVVHEMNCLPALSTCIQPCGPSISKICQDYQDTGLCDTFISDTTSTSPKTTTTATTITENPAFEDAQHFIYLFDLSNRTTPAEFQRFVNFVETPLQQCFAGNSQTVVRIMARNNFDSGWVSNYDIVHLNLVSLSAFEVPLDASSNIVQYDNTTLDLVNRVNTVNIPVTGYKIEPRLILLTDFVSMTFINAFNQDNKLIRNLEPFDFQLYVFNQDAANFYRNSTVIKSTHIHSDPEFTDDADYLIPLCSQAFSMKLDCLICILLLLYFSDHVF